ncbi:hypothetical protein L6452_04673 [Arctium lappa]|uniref:Uncharacterized protein n=1 Tax=Arctium lappa TaxID=4217 RepID=A0ACB9EDV9_ARCLA|nr:hypothetical protein L6452_04673 [Arctium lappa]
MLGGISFHIIIRSHVLRCFDQYCQPESERVFGYPLGETILNRTMGPPPNVPDTFPNRIDSEHRTRPRCHVRSSIKPNLEFPLDRRNVALILQHGSPSLR